MYEMLTGKRARNERDIYQKWYLENQVSVKPVKGFKPVLYKILDTIGL